MGEISLGQLFLLGGPLMWPILLCSLCATVIAIEKIIFFHSIDEDVALLKNGIFVALQKNDIKAAMMACDHSGTPMAKVLKSGLLQYGHVKEEVEAALDKASRFEIHLLEQRLSFLLAIGHVASLLGFLGSVAGMCLLLHTMSVRSMAMNQLMPGSVSGSLWIALITTVAGLVVMIPCILAYVFLTGWLNNYVISMEKAADDLTLFLVQVSDPVQSDDKG